MSGEMEAATLDSGGGWLRWKRKHADIPPGTPCANCETPLQGTYCHVCGQMAEDFHRSSWKLAVEAVESLLHLDGRMFRTLPSLVARPGRLTRDYLDGKRAYQVQPFRMFLVILLVVLFVGHLATKAAESHEEAPSAHSPSATIASQDKTPASDAQAEVRAEIMADPEMSPAEKQAALAAASGDWKTFGKAFAPGGALEGQVTPNSGTTLNVGADDSARMAGFKHWAQARIEAVKDDPERFALILEIWLHRVAILALPVSALMLSLLFVFNRRFFVFDHLVFSMHSLSFQLLLLTTIFLLSMLIGGAAWWLAVLSPVHLFMHMKGAYQRSVFGTLARMFALFVMTTVAFGMLALLWLYLGFNEMAGH